MPSLLTNPGFEIDTVGWDLANGTETLARDSTEFHSGVASGKVVTPGTIPQEGIYYQSTFIILPGIGITTRSWLKGTGTIQLWASTVDGVYQDILKSSDVVLTSSWQFVEVNLTATLSATSVRVEARTSDSLGAQAVTFYVDDAALIVTDQDVLLGQKKFGPF